MTRPHPFEFAFRDVATAVFVPLHATLPTPTLADFAQRQEITDLLDQIAPPDAEGVDPTVRGGMAQLAFLAYRFLEGGEVTVTVEQDSLDAAIAIPLTKDRGIPTTPFYLQLPQRHVWGQINEEAPHEPVDGIFAAPSGDVVCLAAVLGFHPDRMGFSQFTTEVDAEGWQQASQHVRNPPFAPKMDGGAGMGFKSIVSEAELIHLVQLALHSTQR
jgi:hypothetical protein